MNTEPSEESWTHGALVISLDLAEPFLTGMGLSDLDPQALRQVAREAVRSEAPEGTSWKELWLASVQRALGEATRARVDRWVRHAFETSTGDHQDWIPWHSVFGLVERSEEGFEKLGFESSIIPPLLAAYRTSRDTRPLRALEERVRGADMSLWDVRVCARYGFMPDEPGDLLWAEIRNTWENHQFQIFFGQIVALLDLEQLGTLWKRARAVRRADGIDVDRLVDPRTLQPAVPWPERRA